MSEETLQEVIDEEMQGYTGRDADLLRELAPYFLTDTPRDEWPLHLQFYIAQFEDEKP